MTLLINKKQLNSDSLNRWLTSTVFFLFSAALLALAGCSSEPKDETAGWSQNKLYAEAKQKLDESDFPNCIKYFEKLESRFPFGPFAQQAQINIAYCYWKNGENDLGVVAIDRFIKLHPGHDNIDYAYYLKGMITFNSNLGFFANLTGQDLSERDPKAAKDAFEAFKILATRYPNSKYAPDALDRMRYIVNSLAESEVNAARFYYRKGAYLATINRAQQAIKDYDRAPAIEEAMYLMVKSYDALGMKDLSADAMRVFQLNFPDSKIFQTGKRVPVTSKEKSWWQIWN